MSQLSDTTPVAPAGNQNVKVQIQSPDTSAGIPGRVSLYPQIATSTLLGVVVPDNETIVIDSNGKISATGSGGSGGGSASVLFGTGSPSGTLASVVQSKTGAGYAITFANNVSQGNVIFVSYKSEGNITASTISDTLGTAYTKVAAIDGQANNMHVYVGIAPSTGANTVTIGSPANNYDRMGVMEVTALATATVDVTATAFTTSSPFSLAITPTNAPDFIFAAVAGYHNSDVFTFSAPFTLDSQSNLADANAIGHYAPTSAGTVTFGGTSSGGADNLDIILVAVKASTSGGTTGAQGDLYFDTSVSPYVGYVYNAGSWRQFQ
jgi:hypothetical protein